VKKIHTIPGGRGGELAPFEPGERRPAGVPNRTTRVLKETGILAAEIVGFPKFKRNKHGDIVPGSVQATGKDGLIGYLTFVALNEPRAYLGFLGRLLPLPALTAPKPPHAAQRGRAARWLEICRPGAR
jgi:hypothetical protein